MGDTAVTAKIKVILDDRISVFCFNPDSLFLFGGI